MAKDSAPREQGPKRAELRGRTVGIWSVGLRRCEEPLACTAAAELETLGFNAIWIPGSSGGDVFDRSAALLDATSRITVAIGVVNIWMHTVNEVASRADELTVHSGGRFLLGLGASHAPLVERAGMAYDSPLRKMAEFLDGLDADGRMTSDERVLAALGPKMLDVAGRRAAGVHPFNVTPEHTALARDVLGPTALVAPELKVVLERDPSRARAIARAQLAPHLQLPNYVRNLIRLGLREDDVAGTGSDRLVDSLVAWGDEAVVSRRLRDHFDAGADHVCLNVLTDNVADVPVAEWKRLAQAIALPSL